MPGLIARLRAHDLVASRHLGGQRRRGRAPGEHAAERDRAALTTRPAFHCAVLCVWPVSL